MGSNGQELSEIHSIFGLSVSKIAGGLIGLMGPSFLGTRAQVARARIHPLPLVFGGHSGESGLSPFIC